ncbi:MASE4 domain-containing protein [Duganella sp. S19_KUP01_CR8]|uniref:MASE4 domain-containing protein n=1 Tax=Duganella sp. S19_KUP01_CR8 TaxID=3025502 RepID=UPI002FCDC2E6
MTETSPAASLPLLPLMEADRPARKRALVLTLVSVLVFCALLPYTKVPLPALAAFIPIYESSLLLNDLITAVMLFGHFSILRSKSLLVLAGGYLFTALLTVPHMLTFPGLFSPSGWLGGHSQATAWLYVFWHGGFPACVAAYALLGHRERQRPHAAAPSPLAALWAIAAALLAAAAFTVLATAGHDLLPPILVSGHYSLAGRIVLAGTWGASVVALVVLWRYSKRSLLDLWLGVVMAAWLCDIGLSAVLNAGRYDVGWYAGRIYGLFAASCVLIVLLLESNKLFARLVVSHEHALQRSADLQRLNLQNEQRAMQYANALEELHFKEEEIRAVVHNIADCVLTTDAAGVVRSANPALERVFGYAAADVVGRHISLLIPELAVDSERAFIRDGEVEGLHRDGRQLPLELAMNDFEVHGVRQSVVVLADIGERKQFVAELRRAQINAEQANQAKSTFLANMSHELRTPLNAILGFAQILAADKMPVTPEKRREFIQHILKAGKHLLVLINEVLDLAKVESGTLSLSVEAVELDEIMTSCQQMIGPLADKRDLRLRFVLDPGMHVQADHTRLKQVLLNLLSNAVKYNRKGGLVSVTCVALSPERTRIAIQDGGEGLTQAQLAQLFQPFNRLGREASSEEGTGIGLVMTRRLVEMMGGTIGVSSTVGVGSVFWIELKAAAALRVATGFSQVMPVDLQASAGAGQRSLLYVEDNPANLLLVRELIGFRGDLKLLTASEASTGLRLAREQQPDVILMDINLPGMSGNKAMRLLSADPATQDIPVIALSANAMSHDVARSRQEGFMCYLTKPLNLDEFTEALNAALRRSEQRASRSL